MAQRPIFISCQDGPALVKEVYVDFHWSPGFSATQKKKNIMALHTAGHAQGYTPLLEISTKSEVKLGERLSAFNLPVELDDGRKTTVECAFQGSKVFKHGGPFNDIYNRTSRDAKRDDRIRISGAITGFRFGKTVFNSEPKTAFYDWLYIMALMPHKDYLKRLIRYVGFTDIEFNPERSINCQARSCAIFVSLMRRELLEMATSSPSAFINTVYIDSFGRPDSKKERQQNLL